MRRTSGISLTAGLVLAAALVTSTPACSQNQPARHTPKTPAQLAEGIPADSVPEADKETRYTRLSDEDFKIVADQLQVEVAAIKAVVSIEAGSEMKGFWAPGIPVINFDRTMYNKFRSKAANKAGAKSETVPAGLTGYARSEWTQLINARKVNAEGANMGTFWGMFQIGGFNYKLCGCSSVNEMVRRMSYSELEQLELFAAFVTSTGMVKDIRSKNWTSFSRKYNGPSYAKRGYHTKMARAYTKFKAQEEAAAKAAKEAEKDAEHADKDKHANAAKDKAAPAKTPSRTTGKTTKP